jgi:hypothetical protein
LEDWSWRLGCWAQRYDLCSRWNLFYLVTAPFMDLFFLLLLVYFCFFVARLSNLLFFFNSWWSLIHWKKKGFKIFVLVGLDTCYSACQWSEVFFCGYYMWVILILCPSRLTF